MDNLCHELSTLFGAAGPNYQLLMASFTDFWYCYNSALGNYAGEIQNHSILLPKNYVSPTDKSA